MAKVYLLAHTPYPEHTVASAAKLCYSSSTISGLRENLSDESAAKFVEMLSEIGHESPIEHASFTFGIEGVSRALLAQITRHRMASFSVKSQRYVREGAFEYVTPPEIESVPEAKKVYDEIMAEDQKRYDCLAAILKEKHIKTFLSEGKDQKEAEKLAEKKAIEDARFVLPNACETQMIMTMNARSLLNFFKHRCCNRAQWEIKDVADQMLALVLQVAPELFKNAGPACVRGGCSEGKMTCGKANEIREFYKGLKNNG
ncbi:MAG: FAD-dependent thymidylate synthase [Ruminococcaceae bacterium]|nr:FAD-dependent thymidylate synthase [Oscillospiraceae bacterium]